MPTELEAKMQFNDFDALRQRLAKAGAIRIGAVLETNTFFDSADSRLVSSDKGLRLRRSRDERTGGEQFVITVKGPQHKSELKSRDEVEVSVDNGDHAMAVLAALAFEPSLSFEKKRESWELDGCKIELDELPILGRFVEIEGPDQDTIMRVRERLALSQSPLIRTGYITMLARHLGDTGDHRRSITF